MPRRKVAVAIATQPEPLRRAEQGETGVVSFHDPSPTSDAAAHHLVDNLFARNHRPIPGLSYAITYKLAQGRSGGDIVDVYHFDNDAVAFSVADIAGKGPRAAVHAALIKYSLRAYASQGLTPEKVMRALDRLYLENNAFENAESFATVFLGMLDPSRRYMTYSSAAHEPVLIVHPDGTVVRLPVTAPLVGVFDDQHHLFKQAVVEMHEGSLIVATTDGVTEARTDDAELFGMQRLTQEVIARRTESEEDIAQAILAAVERFCGGRHRDDIAIIVARVH
jgi:serine phosphatase RsbU (regulator of sigma subunit)